MVERHTYQDRRPHAVPASLGDLRGPAHGAVSLPEAVAWTGRRTYDLDSSSDAVVMYERVLVEAPSAAELQTLLNETLLMKLWGRLYLPSQVRALWESHFGVLATAA